MLTALALILILLALGGLLNALTPRGLEHFDSAELWLGDKG